MIHHILLEVGAAVPDLDNLIERLRSHTFDPELLPLAEHGAEETLVAPTQQ
jgi:hypothetical protein